MYPFIQKYFICSLFHIITNIPVSGKSVCLFIAIIRMFTVWQMSHEGVNNMLSFIHTNISNVHCFAYISVWG